MVKITQMKKTTLRQVALKLAFVALAVLAPLGLRAQNTQLNEGFEGTTFPPDDWTTIHVSGTNAWARSTGTGNASSSAFAYRKDVSGGYEDYLITPKLVPQSGEELSFYLASQYAYDYAGTTLTIEISTTTPDVSAFTNVLATYTSGSSGNFETSGSSDWVSKTVDVSAYVGQEIYIAFHAKDIGYNADVRIDDVTGVSLYVPACPKPTGLAATLTPGNGSVATLSWTKGGEETNWVVEYSTASDFSGATTVTTGFTTSGNSVSVNLTGLTAEQTYYARVKANCGGGDYSDWSSETGISFTPTNAFSLTVNDGTATNEYVPFYGYYGDAVQTDQLIYPASDLAAMTGGEITQMVFYVASQSGSYTLCDWVVSIGETSATTLSGIDNTTTLTQVYSGAMTFGASSGATTMTIVFDLPYTYNGGNLLIQFNNPVTNNYAYHRYYFTGIEATGASYCYGNQRNFLPKVNFTYEPASAFPKPRNLQVSNVTGHEATLTWEAPNDATPTGYFYHYKKTTDANFNQPINNGTSLSVTLNSLAPETEYQFGVYANYANGASDYKEISFTTDIACHAPTALNVTDITDDGATLGWTSTASNFNVRYRTAAVPNTLFFDDFENGLSQWTIIRNGEGTEYTDWRQFDGNFSSDPITPHSGTYMVMSRSWSSDAYNVDNWLITPQVTLDGTLRFWVKDDGQYHDHYDVYVSTTGNTIADFGTTPFYVPGEASGTWTEITVDLSSFDGAQGYIALRHTDNDQDYLMVDDFAIYGDPTPAGAWTTTTASTNSLPVTGLDEQTTYDFEVQADCGGGEESNWVASTFTTLPSCMPVSTLAVDAATTTTIDLTWTDQNNGAATYVVTDGDDNAYTVTNLTTTGCTVTSLTANTAYTFKVKANCGDGFSSAEMVEGRTACDAITTVPYVESFENADNNYCWTLDGFSVMNNSSYSYEGDKFIIAQNSSTEPRYVVLPEMADDISGLMLNFWWTNYNAGNDLGYLYIGYLTDVNDYTTFEQVGVIDMTSSIDVYEQSADYAFTAAPAGSRMALKYVDGNNGGLILIDKVTVDNLAACMRPTDLAVTTPTAHGATFEWTSNGTESAWQLYISENNTAPADDINVNELIPATTNPFVLTSGLNAETEHYVWVRANCGTDGYSTWVGPETFTTGIACPAPTGLTVDNITGHTADLSWTGTSDNYNIDYRTAAYTNGLVETFDTDPTGWTKTAGALNTDGTATLAGTSSWTRGTNCGVFDAHMYFNMYSNKNYWLITPSMTINNGDALSFDMAYTKYSSSATTNYAPVTGCTTHRFAVLISTDDMATWTILREWNNSGSSYVLDDVSQTGENTGAIDLSTYAGETAYIAFFGHSETSSYDNNFHFDNVTIGTPVAAGEWQHATSDVENKQLTGLNAETKYEVQVQGDCGSEGTSQWTASTFFITDIACMAPTTLAAGTPGPNEVDLTWTKTGTETAWQICLNGDETNLVEVAESDVAITGTTVAYTLDGLTAETPYTVKVRANCEVSNTGDGQSLWSNEVNFTAAADCPVPVLEAVGITNVSGHTADVAWTGFQQNDSYKVWYRVHEHINGISEDFSANPTGWLFRTGELNTDGTATLGGTSSWTRGTNCGVFDAHMYFNMYSNKNYWLITPSMTINNGDALSFDMAYTKYSSSATTNYAPVTGCTTHRFAVLISTDDMATWTILREWNNSGSTYVLDDVPQTGVNTGNIDLSAYAGETAYIAFFGHSENSSYDNNFHFDNVTIGATVPAGTWQSKDVTAPATSTTLTGLDPETPYEVYVTGHCATGDVTTVPSDIQTFTTTVACPAPVLADIDPATITTTTATLTWTGSAASNFTVAYKTAIETDFTEVPATASPFTFADGTLNHSTVYTVMVKADCGGSDGESEWSNTKTFTTACDVISALGYSENFDTYTAGNNVLPTCWSHINTTTNSTYAAFPRVYSTDPNSAPNCLYFYSYSYPSNLSYYDPQPQYAILPEMSDLAGKLVTLQARGSNSSSTYKIGTMSDPTDASTFTIIAEQALTTSYQEFEHIIPTEAQGNYLAIMMDAASGYNNTTRGVYIDDIQITEAPTCSKPSGLQLLDIATNGAQVTWTPGGTETYWDFYLTDDIADVPDEYTTPTIGNSSNNQPWFVNGVGVTIDPATTYYFYVRSHCSDVDQSIWVGPLAFTTECEPFNITESNHYIQNFEDPVVTSTYSSTSGLEVPVCWDNYTNNSSSACAIPHIIKSDAGTGGYNYSDPVSPSQVLYFYGSGYGYAALPEFTNALNTLQISFKWATESATNGTLTLGYITAADNGEYNTFTQIGNSFASTSTSSPSYRQLKSETVYLNNVPAEATRLVFRWYYSGQWGANIDDIDVSLAPSCLPVGTLAEASNITATSADLSWTLFDDNQDAWVVEYATDENFTTVLTADADSHSDFELNGLTPETHYWVRVKADCSNDGYSEVSNVIDFTTPIACPTPTNVAYSDVTPHGATITWEGEAANHVIKYRTVTTVDVDYTYDFEDGMQGWTTIDADGHGDAWYRGDNNNAHNGTYSMQTQYNPSYGHQDYLVSPQIALGGSISFYAKKAADWLNDRFRVYLSTTSNTSASDFTIELTNGDVSPSVTYDLYSYDLSNYSGMGYVAIVYTAPADQYFISIDDINITGTVVSGYGEWQTVDNATSPHVLNNLAPETNYEVIVVGDCGATTSPANDTVDFTTGIACQAPTELTVGTPTHEQVVLSWSENGEATNWVVAYKAESETEYTELNVTTNPYTLDGLDENTPYSVKVKADCGSTEGTSQWSEEKTFTTAETCAAPTAFTLGTITTHEATFSWTAGNGNTEWQVFVKKNADAEYPAIASATVNAATATINGLDDATVYDVKIVPDCDATKVLEVANAFTTECETTVVDADNSFFEGFEGTTFPPICWSVGDPFNNNNWQSSTDYSNTGSVSAYSNFNGPIYLYTPTIYIDGTTATLSFSSYNIFADWYEYGGKNSVLVSVNGGDWTEIWSPASVSESWVVTTIDMTAYVGQNIQLCFKYEGDWVHGWFIDDVNLFVPTVIEKAIEANKWYAISSPVHNSGDNETLAGVSHLTDVDYDLYGYTESAGTWNKPTTVLEQGKGYIYRRSSNTTLNFVGINNSSVPDYTLSYACGDNDLKGFNLVGNPYPYEANPDMDCYKLTPAGTWKVKASNENVDVCEAVLVYTDGSNATVSFSAPAPSKSSSDHAALAFTVSNDEFEDVAYARFDNGEGLPKIGHLNSEAPMLSIPVEGRRYAIANLGSDCESFDLVFRGTAGQYTLTFSNELSLGYCHLVDRTTGNDIDLLRQPKYTFNATGFDAARFMVKLSPSAVETAEGSFVYWNGSAWVVEGNGTLQVFDVLGRKVFSKEVNTEVTIPTSQFPGTGVYIIRLGEKSQKIVVK